MARDTTILYGDPRLSWLSTNCEDGIALFEAIKVNLNGAVITYPDDEITERNDEVSEHCLVYANDDCWYFIVEKVSIKTSKKNFKKV